MQTEYTQDMDASIPGQIQYLEPHDVVTRYLKDGLVAPGLAVAYDSANGDNAVKAVEASDAPILGVTARDMRVTQNLTQTQDTLPANWPVPVLTNGSISVLLDGDVTAGQQGFARFAAEAEVMTLTFDGSLVTGNKINGSIAGEAIAEVTYASSSGATLTALAVAIAALDVVATATVTDTLEITITGANTGEELLSTSSFVVTEGAGQAVGTMANVSGPSASATLGAFRADADDVGSGATAVAVGRTRFDTSGVAGGTAILNVNLP